MRNVFRRRTYIVLAAVVAVIVFLVSVWAQNVSLLVRVLKSSGGATQKATIFWELVSGAFFSMGVISMALAIGIAILFGINLALFVYSYKRHAAVGKSILGGAGGFISGLFGVGCASCGSFFLGSFLASIGATGFITYLPFRGIEFGVAAIILLGISIMWLVRSINRPPLCEELTTPVIQ